MNGNESTTFFTISEVPRIGAIFKEIKTDDDVEALQQELDTLYGWTRYSVLKFQKTGFITWARQDSRPWKWKRISTLSSTAIFPSDSSNSQGQILFHV